MRYISLSRDTIEFVSTMAPFVDRNFGSTWFRNMFPGVTPVVAMSNYIWASFLTPSLLPTRIEPGTHDLGLTGYQPNLGARNFEFSQTVSKLLYTWEDDIC